MTSGMIVKKGGKYYIIPRGALRKLAHDYAEKIGKEVKESEINKPELVEAKA